MTVDTPSPRTGTLTLTVLVPDAFRHAFDRLSAAYRQSTATHTRLVGGPAGGGSPHSVHGRIQAGEYFDLALLPHGLLQAHVNAGRVLAHSTASVMRSLVGMCVAPGSPKNPPIDSAESLRATLLQAPAIALSTAGSGEYVAGALLERLGIHAQVSPKCVRVSDVSVGEYVTQGHAPIGFQQVSELLQVDGIRFGGYLPEPLQHATLISAGIATASVHVDVAQRYLAFLGTPVAHAILRAAGVDPVPMD